MKYPNNLRGVRKNLNVKATDLAELLEITFQHYYAIERGQRQLSATHLKKLTESLNVTADEILGNQPMPESSSETKKMPKDLEKILEQHELMFQGEPLDDEDKQEILDIIQYKLYQRAKQLNKRKK